MKKILIAISTLYFATALAETSDMSLLWDLAYYGQYSLTQKLILHEPATTLDDGIRRIVILAYARSKEGEKADMDQLFRDIDYMIENFCNQSSSEIIK